MHILYHYKRKESWYITDPGLHLGNGDGVPSSTADSTLCYLGGHVSPWSGLQHRDLVDQLEGTFERVRRAQIKPHQKLTLITTHILPPFLHKLVFETPPNTKHTEHGPDHPHHHQDNSSPPTPKGENLTPDLMVVNRGRVHVVDVRVRHEDIGYLEEGYKSKMKKYTTLMYTLGTQHKA